MGSQREWPLILAYHHLSTDKTTRYVMTVTAFERQLRRLLDTGYRPMTLDETVASEPFRTEAGAQGPSFTITFDDGLASFKELALPVLERLGLTAACAVFIPTRFVGKSNEWRVSPSLISRLRRRVDLSEPLMSWDDLRELDAMGVTVGSHGHAHLAMDRLTYDEAMADTAKSRELLLQHGFDARYFALPFGWFSPQCKAAVRDAGFEAAFSVTHGGKDRYDIRRVPVYGTDWFVIDRLKTSGRFFEMFDRARSLAGRGEP